MRHRLAVLLGLCCALSASLLYGVADAWNPSLPDAKRIARENNRPLIVVAGNSRSCTWCQDFDSKVIAKAEWEEYAQRKGIPQYYADGGYTTSYPVMRALFKEYYYANLPTVFIFQVKPGADLTSMDLDAATSVDLIGKYVNVPNVKVNGLTVANTPARFIQVLESFYKTTHPEWLEDLGTGPASASLTVNLEPAGAVAAGAQWQVDGGVWQNSGTALDLAAGAHTVSYKAIAGWTAPPAQAITIVGGVPQVLQATYTPPAAMGSLTVTLTGAAAGAAWRVVGEAGWRASGTTAELAAGTYTVEFQPVNGFQTPAPKAATVNADSETQVEASYLPVPAFADAPLLEQAVAMGAETTIVLPVLNHIAGTTLRGTPVGALPSWLNVSVDQDASTVTLTARPTRAGATEVVLEAQAVQGADLIRGGQITVRMAAQSPLEINPDAIGNFTGTIFQENVKSAAAVRGTVTMTVSDTGRITAKLVMLGKTYSYRMSTWSAVDVTSQTLTATSADGALELSIGPGGIGVGSFTVPGTNGPEYAIELDRIVWHRTNNPATAYEGYYTVALPVNDRLNEAKPLSLVPNAGGYLVFTVKADGKVTYSGKVADGTRFSGSSVVVETAFGSALFTVFSPLYSRRGWIAGQLEIFPGGPAKVLGYGVPVGKDADPFWQWSYPGKNPTRGQTADAFTVTLYPYGVGYEKGLPLEDESLEFTEVTWSLDAAAPMAPEYGYTANRQRFYAGPAAAALPMEMALTAANERLTAPKATTPVRQPDGTYAYNGTNDSRLTIRYSPSAGVFSGSFKLYYDYQLNGKWQHRTVTVPFEGVLTPECRGCSADPLPLGFGYVVTNDAGTEPAIGYAVKRAYPVFLDDANPLGEPVAP